MRFKLLYIFSLVFSFLFCFNVIAQKTVNVRNFQIVTNDTSTDYINNAKGVFTISASSVNATCSGDCDGSITVSIAGAPTFPVELRLTYPASLGGGVVTFPGLVLSDFPYTISGLCGASNPYQIRVKDSDNIPMQYQYVSAWVLDPGVMQIDDYITVNETCPSACDGSVTINFVQNATYPISYLWSSGEPTSNITNKCAGNYTVTITDFKGCTKAFPFPITAPPSIIVDSLVYDSVFCSGGTGTVTVYPSGGTGGFTYNIGIGWQASNTFSGLTAGTYTITITDGTCTGVSNPFTFIENSAITLSAVTDSVSCFGLSDGSINLSLIGGTAPYSYLWSGGQTTEDILGLTIGNYCVTATDFYGCTATACYDVYEPDVITITETHINPCFGASTGAIDLSVSGGSCSSYTYLWSNTAITQDISGLSQGTYNVTVTDCNGCTATTSITLIQNPQITIGETHVNYDCFASACMGSINITVAGGTPCPGYSYIWSNGAVSEDLTNLCIGAYTVTATDCAGCSQTKTITITRPIVITINLVTQTNVSCFGLCNGAININPTGGTPGYTYNWSNGITTQDLTNLCSGSYTVTVTDSRGCTRTRAFTITQPSDITITPNLITNISCNGVCDGAIDLTVAGGTPGYTYSWTGPGPYTSTNVDITNLCAGVYNLTVTDTKPCTKTYSVTITEPTALNLTEIQTDVSCNGICDGEIDITISNGTPGYTYNWTGIGGPYATEDLLNVCAGTYNVTITDANNCTLDSSFTLNAPTVISISDTHIDLTCNGLCNGSIDLTVLGGNPCPNYTYNWTGPGGPYATEDLSNLCAGTYDVTVTDCNACSAVYSVTLIQPIGFTVTETHIDEVCYSDCTGSINITVVGGTAPYTYTWTGPGGPYFIDDLTNLCAGTYDLTITDASSCTATLSVTISEPTEIILSEGHQNIAPCFGNNNGWITVSAVGGSGSYAYDWSPNGATGDGTPTYSNLPVGSYTVTVTDVPNGCTKTLGPINIIQPADITVSSVDITNVSCFGGNDGSFTIHASGGSPPYLFDNGFGFVTDSTFSGLSAGTYTVTVQDVPTCSTTYTVTITQPTVLSSSITAQTNVTCGGNCNGLATVTVNGGTMPYSYLWCDGQITQTAINLCAGVCVVTITDFKGCTTTASVTITAPPAFSVVVSDSTMSCGSFPTQVAGTTFLPDGSGASYSTSINQTDFPGSATINSISDISSICFNMEHSWLGDLTIDLICPNGQSIQLKEGIAAGGGTYLGEPVSVGFPDQNSADVTPGTGYDYCFVPSGATYGTMVATASTYIYSYIDNAGNSHVNRYYLPAGSYTPFQSFNNLLGCPINGTWTVNVTDNMGLDNGYIFSWLINFDPSTYPFQYCNGSATVSTVGGQAPFTYFWSNGGSDSTITDLCSGNYCVTVNDANSCSSTACVNIVDVNLNITSFTKTDASCNGVCNGSATVNTSGGYAPITYLWSNGLTTQTISNLCAGQYIVTVTEVNGCLTSDTVTISNLYAVTANTNIINQISCNGFCDGSALATVGGGGTMPYSYLWCNTQTTPTATNLCAGACGVTVTDANGCFATSSVTITAPPILTASILSQSNVSCNGVCDGSATVLANGGTAPYTYLWCNTQTTATATGLCAGGCTVTVSDAKGCTATTSVTITEPTVLTSSITSQTPTSCNGVCDGTATVTANGGTPGYTYNWCTGENISTTTGLCAGVCGVIVIDANGCTTTSTVTITSPPVLTASITAQTNVTCNGLCDGTATVSGNGGTPGYTYLWCNTQTTSIATGLCAGVCGVTVTDANGCTTTSSVTITEPTALTSSFTAFTNVNCGGSCTGSLTITGSGGTGSYTYTWSPAVGNTATVNNLCAGIYHVTVADSLLCTTTNWFEITDTSTLSLSLITSNNPTCNGLCDGNATVSASGGFPPYNYVWNTSPVQNGPTAINLCDAIYTVMVQDDSLCSRQINVTITEPVALSFTTSVTNPVCNADCNGTATATVSGGTIPYSYLWCDGQTTQTAIGLCAQTCAITVTDANSCLVAPQTVTITSPPILSATLDITQNISCNSSCDGVLTANPTGGVLPYTYSWFPNISETGDFSDSLCSDNYSVTITDFNGCTVVVVQTLNTPSPVIATISNTSMVGCHGNCSGTATVAGSGGTAPYTYNWCNSDTTVTADSLCAGFCGVTITDFNGCIGTSIVNIIDTSNLNLDTVSITQPLCFGLCNGSITVIANGGYPSSTSPFYTYIWSDTQTGTTANNLCSGNITVTVVDDSLCSRLLIFNLSNPPQITSSTSFTPTTCSSICDGIGIVSANGGTGQLSYVWSDALPQTNDTAIGLCSGVYFVTISDQNNCSIIDSVDITSPPSIILTISEVSPITCYNSCNGSLTANVFGGTAPYNYLWSNLLTTDTINGLCVGTYILTVTDVNLCQVIDSITITQPDSLQLSFINVTQIACGGGNCTGEATALVIGGNAPYNYNWDLNANTGDTLYADSLCGNIYSLTVTDFNGCTVINNVAIIDTSNLSISIIDTNMVTCSGACDGSATVFATGGYPPYTYLWNTNPQQTTATATNLCQGTYFVTVYDDSLCSRVAMIDITDAAALQVTDSIIPISCTGLCDASIILIPTGGTPPYVTYQWSIIGETDSIANNLCAGTYYYTVTDSNSCSFSDSVTISDPGSMQANLSIVNPILCHGVCVGSITANPSGSFGYTYLWSNNDTTQTIINLCSSNYFVTITGQGGCFVTDSINMTEPDTMLVSFINIQQVNCGGDCSGTVEAVATGGTPLYTYQWDANAGNSTNPMIDSLCANLYFITVSDANGCSQNLNFEVTDTSNLTVLIIDSSMVSCFGRCDGWVTVNTTGGTLPYSYLWNNTPIADTTVTADSLCAGQYLITVTDLNLCSRVKLVNITQPDSLYAIISDSLSIKCNADCNGSLTASIIGGTPLYNLLWNNSSADSVLQNLCVGTYKLTVTDLHNCVDSLTYTLFSPPAIITTLTANGALCNNNSNDGSITTTISGGTSPYILLWSNDSITLNITNLNSGTYWLTVTDSLGCNKIDSATIGASITVNATAKWDTTLCYGDSVQIFGFGGNVYTWSPTIGLNDSTIFDPWAHPTQTTTYYFTAWDSICFDIDSVTIQIYPQIGVDAGIDQTILTDHSATLTATSSDPLATFIWSPTIGLSDSTNSTTIATPNITTSYIVFATNNFGCIETDTVLITVIPKIIVPNGITPNNDGANDVWMIDFINYFPNCEIEIYNRWGEKLFYSKGYPDSERWDGTFKGKELPTGTYYYIINLHDELGTKPLTGPITIMR